MVVYGGAIADGNRHNHDDLPVILAGGSALGIQHAPERSFAPWTPLCNLYLSMLGKMQVKADRFGDSTGAVALDSDRCTQPSQPLDDRRLRYAFAMHNLIGILMGLFVVCVLSASHFTRRALKCLGAFTAPNSSSSRRIPRR